ncbi:NXPE family member 3-like [Strongylocentrotus purpuratus]|uniref:NXPE C-terminal domain-containing protein n=1 Tax=Strongylocentrotus purpuratus TaxID=7668 RepID=A0A7M7NSV8_STRPU|nr:NXPE family member 3-like [Strongylocentrotus purpuratus]
MRSFSDQSNQHSLCPSRTARKFPRFAYPSVQPINWTNHMDITNNTLTTFELINPKETYFICDELELHIYARNGRNESKQYGGDLFRAKIFTTNSTYSASSSTDGEIVDNGNGTYNAYFTLKWTGVISISVSLIYSSEATYVLDRIRTENQPRIVYYGAFVSENKTQKEGFCNIQLRIPMKEKEFCDFTDETTGSPWFCEKPVGFGCSDWKKHRIDGGKSEQQAIQVTNATEREAFKVSKTQLTGPVKSVTVIRGNATQALMSTDDLPVCSLGYNSKQPEIAGYYDQGNWFSPTCRVHRFRDVAQIKKCFSNRQLFFLGDSTIRQLHEYYLKTLNLSMSFLGEKGTGYTGPVSGKDSKNNITTLFAFHKYPVGKKVWTYDKDLEYIATRIGKIASSGSPVVVVSVWAHFESAPPLFYEKRVRGIVAAMGRLLDRNKRAVVLFKGGNTRQYTTFGQHTSCSDWYARGNEERMRNIIFQDSRIGFIDAWDMTHAQLQADNVHPTGFHIVNINDKLLTLLGCS